MEQLLEYGIRIFPGLFILSISYFLLPKKERIIKMFLLLFGFILMRDTMTPLGFWEFGFANNTLKLRFINDPLILLVLGFTSLVVSLVLYRVDEDLKRNLKWFSNHSKFQNIIVGILSSLVVVLPFRISYFWTSASQQEDLVPLKMLLPLMIFALLGNFLEEILFRGYFQNYLKKQRIDVLKRVLLSALFFSIGHIFLASTVTNLGVIILIFTFWEGLVCAVLYEKYGIISATLAHGLSIFLLSSGIFF